MLLVQGIVRKGIALNINRIFAILSVITIFIFSTQGALALEPINNIFLQISSQSPDADRFKMLLRIELGKNGFKVLDSKEESDAILEAAITVRQSYSADQYGGSTSTRGYATCILKDRQNNILWAKDFSPKFFRGFKRLDSVAIRAEDIAKSLKKELTTPQVAK